MRESRFNQCLEMFRNGKNNGLEEIYKKYHNRCMMMAMSIVRNKTLAEEVASITLINIIVHTKNNGGHINNPSAWVYEIVKNAAYKLMSKESLYTELNDDIESDNLTDRSEVWMDFDRAIAPLSDRQKEYAKLHYIFELKYREIAATFDVSEAAVKQSFQHIKVHLKKYFKNK